jgi:hypothetical protein
MLPDWVSGSVVLMSRQHFKALNGWSEDYWMYYEDADLCKRAWEMGSQVGLVLNLKIVHNHGGASRINRQVKALTKSEVITSRHVYIHKHARGLKRFLMQTYLVLNNLFLSQLLVALVGVLFFFKPSFRVYPMLYGKVVKYYVSAWWNRTWISSRSLQYKNTSHSVFENTPVEAFSPNK